MTKPPSGRIIQLALRIALIFRNALKVNGIFPLILRGLTIFQSEGLSGIRIRLSTSKNIAGSEYQQWIELHESLDERSRAFIRLKIDSLMNPPILSVLMPTCDSNIIWLKEAIESVKHQLYPHWELCIADDVSINPEIKSFLLQCALDDSRIKLIFSQDKKGISGATNAALSLAKGQWIVLLDHDDLISEDALYRVALAAISDPNLCLIYSDEDRIDSSGTRFGPYFKGGWNPDLFYSQNFISHLGAYKRDLVEHIGGFRTNFDGSQDYDLALRCI